MLQTAPSDRILHLAFELASKIGCWASAPAASRLAQGFCPVALSELFEVPRSPPQADWCEGFVR